jgi:hypothetical protein
MSSKSKIGTIGPAGCIVLRAAIASITGIGAGIGVAIGVGIAVCIGTDIGAGICADIGAGICALKFMPAKFTGAGGAKLAGSSSNRSITSCACLRSN